ncbi:MAG: thiamine pyrophosphate-binding protein [bacterium]
MRFVPVRHEAAAVHMAEGMYRSSGLVAAVLGNPGPGSAARENLRITTVVMAEGSWTMEEPNERMLYGRTFGTDMGTVRWDKVGEGLGCRGEYVERVEDLEPALGRAKTSLSSLSRLLWTERI